MDYRLALLLQTFRGLKLDPADLTRLISLRAEAQAADVLDAIHDANARAHLIVSNWLEHAGEVLARSAGRGVRWSYLGQADYPHGWYDLTCRPMIFSYVGDPVWMTWATVAVVGSRTPSPDTCRWLQREFALTLSTERVAVVSGGARGVDQMAHRLAIAADRPTICVLPSGLMNPYPPGVEPLLEEIVARGGCLVSTFGLSEAMRKQMFPIRNRWIAGLSRLTFVAEANHRSGSFLTAQLAAQEERTVCTLPVSANASQGLANLQLIADGHVMVRDAADLKILMARKVYVAGASGPGPSERIHRDAEEDHVDQPEGDPRG